MNGVEGESRHPETPSESLHQRESSSATEDPLDGELEVDAGGTAGFENGEPATLIAPLGGRLLLFDSTLAHEVLPTHNTRCVCLQRLRQRFKFVVSVPLGVQKLIGQLACPVSLPKASWRVCVPVTIFESRIRIGLLGSASLQINT